MYLGINSFQWLPFLSLPFLLLKIIFGVRSSLALIVSVFHVDLKKTQVVSVTYTKNAFQFIYVQQGRL